MNDQEMKENLLQIWEWHWPQFREVHDGRIAVWRTRSGEGRMTIHLFLREGFWIKLECDRILKLSGVAAYSLRRINFRGAKLAPEVKQAYTELFTEKFFLWRWAYKPAERFVGGVVDGREQGVMVIYTPEGETE